MSKLIHRILVKLGLRSEPPTWSGNVGWKWYGGYGRVKSDDWIIFGDTATAEGSTTEAYECDLSTSVKYE